MKKEHLPTFVLFAIDHSLGGKSGKRIGIMLSIVRINVGDWAGKRAIQANKKPAVYITAGFISIVKVTG